MVKTLVITSGGFDPLHAGHISAFERMAKVGDLWVICNSNVWLRRKKEKEFDPDNFVTVGALRSVKRVIPLTGWYDEDGSVIRMLDSMKNNYPEWQPGYYDRIVFAKSGDRTHENSPEYQWCLKNDVEWLEVESDYPDLHSSKILKNWQNTIVERGWGWYKTTLPYEVNSLGQILQIKPKLLCVYPNQKTSMQSHKKRSEIWYVLSGYGIHRSSGFEETLKPNDSLTVYKGQKHQIENIDNKPLVILEWQIGESVEESDIIRYNT